ncbi:hypothetical protein F0562_028457 [Nyssa sinensis]|uniref:Uncharacterized protein n=1 Tax=Nyssa sinensis TaxID=561372 RepID=A0A5J5AZZ8_9ASTE|nr:hypothetical protein F0562_028457 [Nyssa sinensis]
MRAVSTTKEEETQKLPQTNSEMTDGYILEETAHDQGGMVVNKKNRTAELAASSGGALALAILLNKALFPVWVPITVALTPPVARYLVRQQIGKNSGMYFHVVDVLVFAMLEFFFGDVPDDARVKKSS